MWEDSGFKIYEQIGTTYAVRAIDDNIGAPTRRRLEMRETLDSLKSNTITWRRQQRGYHRTNQID